MNGQDWEHFGEEIRRTVQNAVDSQDFVRLNQTISDTINRAVGGAAWRMKNFGDAMDRTVGNMGGFESRGNTGGYGYRGDYGYQGQAGTHPPVLYKSTTASKAGGIILAVVGYALGGIALAAFIVRFIVAVATHDWSIGFQITVTLCALLAAGFGVMAGAGTVMLGNIERFRKYLREIGGREYCNIKELETRLGKSAKYIVKDVEKMIAKGWFRQGHLDKQKTCLILTDRAYQEYLQVEARRAEQEKETAREAAVQTEEKEEEAQKNQTLPPEVQKIIAQGDAFIQKIHECNEAIPGEEISAKISRMEMLVDRIFDRVESNPETVPDIRKLMEYYLPTTVKLLEAYEQMDKQPIGGENIQTAKKEIEATLDTLNLAFEKLLDDLFQDTAWDVASDISVLNTMLAQEGLKNDGLKEYKGGKRNERV